MARIRVPSNCSSITLATSGALTPDSAGIVTCTAAEATAICGGSFVSGGRLGSARLVSTDSIGNVQISVPSVITGITINSVAYTQGTATPWGVLLSAAVPAPAAASFLYQNFALVNG